MPIVKRILALSLSLLMLMMTAARAEVPFLVHTNGWTLENTPVEVLLKANVDAHMPFDEDRLAMLTPVTDLLSLRLVTSADDGLVTVGGAGQDALTMQYRGNQVQLSSMPGVTYSAPAEPLRALLGAEVSTGGLYEALSLSPRGESLLEDGRALLLTIPVVFEEYGKKTRSDTSISGYGRAATRWDFTFSEKKVDAFKEGLLANCPEGWLSEIIASLTFSGRQTIRIYLDANEQPLRMEYNGVCGTEGDLRTVKLVCRQRHDDGMDKDYVELTSPAKKGKNKNNLTFERTVELNKDGTRTVKGSYKYNAVADGVRSDRIGEFDLCNACTDAADVLTGTVHFSTRLNGAEKYDELIIAPALTFSGSEEAPHLSGTLEVTQEYSDRVTEHAVLSVELKAAEPLIWNEQGQAVDLSLLDTDTLLAVRQEVAASVATALVRPLVLAMGQDAQWFFRDLPEDAVQSILDAASAQ